jgi:hypothetical protein
MFYRQIPQMGFDQATIAIDVSIPQLGFQKHRIMAS